ncbi:MAG: GFA family protein [Rhodobacteraceae bacterium]|nr:GFA family protein [Paracoccaceae bacterium]
MTRGWREEPAARGGCQCGAVRYSVAAGPAKSVVCHCRMCQRATGNAFAPLHEVPAAAVTWAGSPAEWASSDIARRGFCATCGTPLYYRSGDTVELMAGTLAPPFAFRPVEQIAVESRRAWVHDLATLPGIATPPDWRVASRQAEE